MFEYRQANLLPEQLIQQKNCVVHTKALESHYPKVIIKSPKGQLWTCNAKEIMWAIILYTIIANSKNRGTCSEYNSHADKGKVHYGYPKYSNYSHWCGGKRQRATCHWSQMAFDNGFFQQTQKTLLRFTFSNICWPFFPPLLCSLVISAVIESIYFLISPEIE